MEAVLSPFLDFLYPPICLTCDTLLPSGCIKVCDRCWNSIRPLDRSHPLYNSSKQKLVTHGSVDDLVSCYVFEKEGTFQKIAHGLKYRSYRSLGVELGRRAAALVREQGLESDLAVPVPLHRGRQRERGYNQAALIADGLSRELHCRSVPDLLVRVRATETQTKLHFEERQKNMEGAFAMNSKRSALVRGARLLLVDDVITTGATLLACAAVLKRAGASHITAVSAALAERNAGA